MTYRLSTSIRRWPMREAFVTSRDAQLSRATVQVAIADGGGHIGRGEGCGVSYAGETGETMLAQIEAVRGEVERGINRHELLDLLGPGGARAALDAGLWDLEAKASGRSVFDLTSIGTPRPLTTTYTIGIRSLEGYEDAARRWAHHKMLKVKVGADDPVAAIEAVRRGAPESRFVVDPNQSWSADQVSQYAPALVRLGVILLEQPIKVGDEHDLAGREIEIAICADELINDVSDLSKAQGCFQVVNIKLDKSGGLTAALALAEAAIAMGFDLMVGCMEGSSLSMAPATVLGQKCTFVDLDGPLLQAEDWPDGLRYEGGRVYPPDRLFWG